MPAWGRVRVVGRGKSGRLWAAFMCTARDEDCPPEWVPDTEIYNYWKRAADTPIRNDEEPPF
jgi:hypothetical protein